jgi:hypothetical protein
LSADCQEVSGSTVTFSTDCSVLVIEGDGSIVTINSGVTIDRAANHVVDTTSSTNTTITNNGTIEATDSLWGIRNTYPGHIANLINNGTITADGSGIRNGGTITILTNAGTISAVNGENGIVNKKTGIIETLTNSGTISSSGRYALQNVGFIETLENSGTISASNYAINNKGGEIVTFTNTGTLTPTGGGKEISNQGTITTFNNSQGKLCPDPCALGDNVVDWMKSLPTNYNVIVNPENKIDSTDDYGQIEFSSFSGQTNTILDFGVHTTLSNLEANTTYSSVLSGLSSSNITITLEKGHNSPSTKIGLTRYYWTLENRSGSLWDLKIGDAINITTDTVTSVTSSVKPNVILGINNLSSVTEVNFANMNTYDCDLFDKNNICLSLGGRHTAINTPKTESNSAVMVGGYKLSDTLRVAGFYHRNFSHKTPASFTLSDKTPMTGGLLVWNQNPNHLGYQLKLANAYQQKNATLTREVVGSSEEGKGETVIEAKSYVAELQYGYQYGDNTVLRPYFAARSAVIKQDAYTETGLSSPLTFNEIKDKSTTVLLGLKFNTNLTHKLSLKGSVGVEHDIEHSVDKLAPTGISGLSTVSLTDSFNETRPVVSLGFDYALKPNHRLSATLQYQELPYESKTESNVYLYYTIGF